MAKTFYLEIDTPTRQFFSESVQRVVLKTPMGEVGVLPGHIPMVIAVSVGPIRIKQNGKWREAFLSEGFMEVTQDRAVILTDDAEWPEEIDENRAKEAMLRAEERLHRKLSKIEYIRSQAALSRAMERLKIKSNAKKF